MPRSVWALGFAAMFMDVSSELVHSLLPVFMSSVLGASMLAIGVIEGIAEATASIMRVFSGTLSDHLGKRKPLVIFGYGLSALSKPLFPMASSIGLVAAARFVDRIGKGVRGAPRDALVADVTPATLRGAAYGLRQALDSVGAFLGPLLAFALMAVLHSNMKAVLWVAAAPALVAMLLIISAVREPERPAGDPVKHTAIRFRDARGLGRNYWLIVTFGAVFTLARFSEAFLVLRAQQAGLGVAYVPIVMIVMNAVYTAAAYPAGAASDTMSHRKLLLGGLGVLVAADLILASASSVGLVLAGAAFWGLHMALTQGLFSKLVADTAPVGLRGTAFGVFNLFAGVSVLLASAIAGALWNSFGPAAMFLTGAAFATIAAAGLFAQGATE